MNSNYYRSNYTYRSKLPQLPAPKTIPIHAYGINKIKTKVLRALLNTYLYIWLKPTSVHLIRSFWIYPVSIKYNILYTYYWNGIRWIYSQIPINSIDSYY